MHTPAPDLRIVDLRAVMPAELDDLWQAEARWWRDRLLWEVSDAQAALRRVVERGGVPGKAVQVGSHTVGYAYYVVAGHVGVISGFVLAPEWNIPAVGGILVRETIDAVRQRGVRRIESQFIAPDSPWLIPSFEHEGFRTYGREFLRVALCDWQQPASRLAMGDLEPWRGAHLIQAASIMQASYEGGIDVEINQLFGTSDGCRAVLENILNQGGCGMPVFEASAMVRHRGRGIGFAIITEIAPRQGHLVQVAVLPGYQHQGVARSLLDYSVSRLSQRHFEALSLIVSRSNTRAYRLYQTLGFQSILSFPVFVWDG
jgi:ribosomal protein S18 acetylase RimI-like enzyme